MLLRELKLTRVGKHLILKLLTVTLLVCVDMADNESDGNVSIFSLCSSFEMVLPRCFPPAPLKRKVHYF